MNKTKIKEVVMQISEYFFNADAPCTEEQMHKYLSSILPENMDKEQIKKYTDKTDSFKYVEQFAGESFFSSEVWGSQSFPDFLICIDGFVVVIEMKSSKTTKVMWNSHIPFTEKNILYFISFKNKKVSRNFIVFGDDLISPTISKMCVEYFDKIKLLSDEFNKSIRGKNIHNDIEWEVYPRKMIDGNNLLKGLNSHFTNDKMLNKLKGVIDGL